MSDAGLPAVVGVLDAAARSAAGFGAEADIVALQRSEASIKALAKLAHDLRALGRNMEVLLQMIEDGDSFAGEIGMTLIAQARKSIAVVEPATSFLSAIYRASGEETE